MSFVLDHDIFLEEIKYFSDQICCIVNGSQTLHFTQFNKLKVICNCCYQNINSQSTIQMIRNI